MNWQPIETAPSGVSILVFYPAFEKNDLKAESYICQAWKRFGNWFATRDGYGAPIEQLNDPTHWMPLPTIPDLSK